MLFCTPQNISVFLIGIELGVTASNIPMAGFDIARNRMLTSPVSLYGDGLKLTGKIF